MAFLKKIAYSTFEINLTAFFSRIRMVKRLKGHSIVKRVFRQNDSIKNCFCFLIGALAAVFLYTKEN
ncbi:hypothetical protein LEP1GSC133_4592 [Leptospira borgpetersenii serovar Pomona str. 200901868]|uniref:Uncharacterized protein n=1 Tax=Leptospira borgpetersenii serovar Pomona str. 200901868 TaxID=1192866 RepID=M6WPJ7_LEPBO|nr:hypothetical protein LEP1GSC133_4592 [Leptospira borgpetersenii serovar Pomona str. 200901868]